MEQGQTFPEFVLTCARAFGALIEMRDEPLDKAIPEKFKVSNYYVDRVEQATAELARLRAMSIEERLAFGEKDKAERLKMCEKRLAINTQENARLHEMREKVIAWKPPTPEHNNLKKFMLEQINISMHDLKYLHQGIQDIKEKSPMDFYKTDVEINEHAITTASMEHRKEIDRAKGRTDWVQQLRDSLVF